MMYFYSLSLTKDNKHNFKTGGYWYDINHYNVGSLSGYWSVVINISYTSDAWGLYIYSSSGIMDSGYSRRYGRSIR